MTEKLLQFIWQYRLFDQQHLLLHSGEPLQILHPGRHNTHQGPDFIEARLRIANTLWAGQVELHVQSSGWFRHNHQNDPNYRNVILHVVWDHDGPSPGEIPLLILNDRIPKWVLAQYQRWMEKANALPCAPQLPRVPDITWTKWLESLMVERLIRKTEDVKTMLRQNQYHWEETCWWMLARNFGLTVNAETFGQIARSLPLRILQREAGVPLRLEALLLGQGNLLHSAFTDSYPKMLSREYHFLRKKYNLHPVAESLYQLRMRPGNFPAVRLAQLAALLAKTPNWFSNILSATGPEQLSRLFQVTANDYWHYHYQLEGSSAYRPKTVGRNMQHSLVINTAVPLVFAYGHIGGKKSLTERALEWLQRLPAEKNSCTARFAKNGKIARHAGESQAMTELSVHYCQPRRCLQCAAGLTLLRHPQPDC